MKSFRLLNCIPFVLAAGLFYGCNKEEVDRAVTVAPAQSNASAQGDLVLTPVGYMHRSHVHFVEEGYHLSIEDNRIKKIENKTRKIVHDFGLVTLNKYSLNNISNGISSAALASGWITFAYWFNDTSKPVSYFSTNWIVPSAPETNSGQTIFLFNGMQDGFYLNSHIFQPVLQWGPSAAGGGPHWGITSWYVSGNEAFYGALVKVSSGINLQGIIETTGKNCYKYSYHSSFKGYSSASALQVNNVPQLYWAAETLEAYGISKNSDYPPDLKVKMDLIQVLKNSKNADLQWTPINFPGTPQHSVIVSNNSPGGEVDIYFHRKNN
jgi:hypothetical protein